MFENVSVTRRQVLQATGAGVVSVVSFDFALAQPPRQPSAPGAVPSMDSLKNIRSIPRNLPAGSIPEPKQLAANTQLATLARERAAAFQLAGQRLNLRVDASKQMGSVTVLDLPRPLQQKFKRRTTVVETVASGITDKQSVAALQAQLKRMPKLPIRGSLDRSGFFHLSLAQRDVDPREPRERTAALSLSKRFAEKRREDMLLAFSPYQSGNQQMMQAMIIGQIDARVLRWLLRVVIPSVPSAEEEPAPVQGDQSGSVVETPERDYSDFEPCFFNCLKDLPPWYLAIVTGLCGACTVTIVGLAAGGVDWPLVAATCGTCAIAVGGAVGICVLGCIEALES